MSLPHQELLPNIDPRLGFLTSHPPAIRLSPPPPPNIPAHLSTTPPQPAQHLPQPPAITSSTRLQNISTPPPAIDPGVDSSDSELEGDDPETAHDQDLDIDEISDNEEDRAAHKLLQSTPIVAQEPPNGPLSTLPYSHHGFAVSPLCVHIVDPHSLF